MPNSVGGESLLVFFYPKPAQKSALTYLIAILRKTTFRANNSIIGNKGPATKTFMRVFNFEMRSARISVFAVIVIFHEENNLSGYKCSVKLKINHFRKSLGH